MPVAYKMVRDDLTSFHETRLRYTVGETMEVVGTKNGEPCGVGLHVCPEPHVPLKFNVRWPWRLLEVEYDDADVLGRDAEKVRVSKLTVRRELDPWDIGLPNAQAIKTTVERWMKVKPKVRTDATQARMERILKDYVKKLVAADDRHRQIELNRVAIHSLEQWASVRDSVWASVRDSVWASVRASVWDSGSPRYEGVFDGELRIAEEGALFMGIDSHGTAHVVMPAKKELK